MLMILLLIISSLYKLNAVSLIFFIKTIMYSWLWDTWSLLQKIIIMLKILFLIVFYIIWQFIELLLIFLLFIFYLCFLFLFLFLYFYLLHHYFFTVIEILTFFNKNIKIFQTSFFSEFFINIILKYIILLNYSSINK